MPTPEPRDLAAADLAACRRLLRAGSKSFYAASLLLPKAVRDPACALYAFCRLADDAVDVDGGGQHAVVRLRERLDRVYAGAPQAIAADRALARIVVSHALPRTLLDALIEGFEWDSSARRYESLGELHAYAARVAGAVGAMMALLMGVRASEAIARACDLGVAMQLTNIARDVGEDARNGRLYLPRVWLREAGIDADLWLTAPVFDARLASVIERLLIEADRLYARVDSGIAQLPAGCRPGINAARLLYAEIGQELRRRGGDSVSQRAVVPGSRKLALLMQAYAGPLDVRAGAAEPAIPETCFLIDAVAAAALPSARADEIQALPWWRFRARALWVLDLFERLERQERQSQALRHRASPSWTETELLLSRGEA
ncbi:phytoene/squalene synthase family protein [Nevskia ramosa]|uniref:phytoene/squalene synthase family protein n=1 Tax=Nevskia ramosa TaxID=64002 RepID=UPI0003B3E305|nr:phytoene/squalene synthase family protein [Nevskia ramosa]